MFASNNGTPRHVHKWDGSVWQPIGQEFYNSYVSNLSVDNFGVLYASGSFQNAQGYAPAYICKWDGNNWVALNAGAVNGSVFATTFNKDNNLYIGGSFTYAGNVLVNNIAKYELYDTVATRVTTKNNDGSIIIVLTVGQQTVTRYISGDGSIETIT